MFYQHSAPNLYIYLVVYVDDIVITSNDRDGITNLKQHLFKHILGIKVAGPGFAISQCKYA